MKDTKDNFSQQSDIYANYRPGYPQELFDWLYAQCNSFDTAWDCATGNGQAAVKIVAIFQTVCATDLSISQLENSTKKDNIIYQQERAEQPSFADNNFDLVTVAQSLHWFDHAVFFEQVKRVAKNGAVFAAWGYNLPRVSPTINDIVDDFYTHIVGPYWDAERKHVDNEYASIEVPFEKIEAQKFKITYEWAAEHMLGYLNTWSSVQHYIKKNNKNPVDLIASKLMDAWGAGPKEVTFPVFMRAGRVKK
ncbi:MAG: class I SAM-dependent methyltransferase [Chitinophagales bacterium]|nr:class I SAM-dependent methyltransferase [Chitinophagales bacterium]